MENIKTDIIRSLKEELSKLFIVGVSVFLFILFFQPFPLNFVDFENRLLFITGYGVITFLISGLILAVLPLFTPKWLNINELKSNLPFIPGFLLLVLNATAFAFYLRYVGTVHLSLYIVFKIVLVSLLPLIILMVIHKQKLLKHGFNLLKNQNNLLLKKLQEFERIEDEKEIEIFSNNKSDKLSVKYKNIISVKSADNYIEISYLKNNSTEKKLIRNTLKNIEEQLSGKQFFIRCHRTSIVNILFVEKLLRTQNGNSLQMSTLGEDVPVSRQYLLKVKEAISTYK